MGNLGKPYDTYVNVTAMPSAKQEDNEFRCHMKRWRWVDFVKSGCEKSWAEVQADSFSFECRGCTRMKELEVELEQLRLLVVAAVGREQVVCASGSGEGTVDKVGEDDERDARVNSPQPGRRLR